MKLSAVLASLVAAAAAQRIEIFAPTSSDTVPVNQDFIVSVVEPNSQTTISEIGIGIAMRHCNSNPCAVSEALGTSLYTGTYAPTFDPATENMPNQNFTVTLPSGFASGPALLSVVHASFIGASTTFFTEVVNVTVNVA